MARQLSVDLVAVESKIWSGEAAMVVARTTEGELGIQPGHTPLLGQLAESGQVRIKLASGEELAYDVAGGFLSVTGERVTVLAEDATPATPAAESASPAVPTAAERAARGTGEGTAASTSPASSPAANE